jgi:hypothetical protein
MFSQSCDLRTFILHTGFCIFSQSCDLCTLIQHTGFCMFSQSCYLRTYILLLADRERWREESTRGSRKISEQHWRNKWVACRSRASKSFELFSGTKKKRSCSTYKLYRLMRNTTLHARLMRNTTLHARQCWSKTGRVCVHVWMLKVETEYSTWNVWDLCLFVFFFSSPQSLSLCIYTGFDWIHG